ncbi:hypothetical protein CY0110_19747 [Crocosphaera chwakensis CCY0110]|uniref:Uncharacterized protein n=1 Tax=Crocosphaera chwakensis CCY0110 TaxID=391612 RepID=A3IJT1_9CHRO|nr:hypothetical protein CY0110_19747 [Crocosphaera chwakensis CCY0110]
MINIICNINICLLFYHFDFPMFNLIGKF